MKRADDILPWDSTEMDGDIVVSRQRLRQADRIEVVRMRREQRAQDLGFSSRPFVLCGLPIKRPPKGQLIHERRNGDFLLEITGHPKYGLPFGQDRLIPLFLSSLAVRRETKVIKFDSAKEMLETFGLQSGGKQYRRLVAGFERVFGATIFFGTDTQREKAKVIRRGRFNFVQEVELWYERDPRQRFLPGGFQNIVVLTDEFYHEIMAHPIPADMAAVRVLAHAPAALDLFLWLCYRCRNAKGKESIPLFGPFGLMHQLGSAEYSRERKFRQQLKQWLKTVRAVWPECPAVISRDKEYLDVDHAVAIHSQRSINPHASLN
jgi:Plasmid encoded RepA protein